MPAPHDRSSKSRRIRTFHGRHGRQSDRTRRVVSEVGPRYALDTRTDPTRPLVVEVGCGSGEAALAFADAHPDTDVVAIDVHTPGIAALLRDLESLPRSNVFVEGTDALDVIEALPPASLAAVHVFFPDPWPKVRHHKRRFIRSDILDLVAEAMAEGAPLRFATDVDDYADHALKELEAHPAFAGGVSERPSWRPVTRYEQIGLDHGRRIAELSYRRLPREVPMSAPTRRTAPRRHLRGGDQRPRP